MEDKLKLTFGAKVSSKKENMKSQMKENNNTFKKFK